ncbi:nucleotidyltransferase domain-containing protein [Paenibacillus daejeonensis]|uniref:nucleotidyltransferase domain-containing protein n=1 Tax=Paenibacillus daejeonensis TaxID=135193 RepID=UPI00036D08E9|nr:nucleotidyltransferase domain-containing protein [Paenibacillus daejeonensis]
MNNTIQQQIRKTLSSIEREEAVRILYACESGSRAWGFPSQDSDYDVRFLYIRQEDWYLSIFDKHDVIERPINDQLDVSGWDLRKALLLLRKSNPPLLEWLQSPIVYAENAIVTDRIRQLSPAAFSPKSCMYHYLHMARGNYRDYLQGDRVKIKKYFYVLRPLLACGWIERHGTLPPLRFQDLVQAMVPADSELHAAIQDLLDRKMAGDELDKESRIEAISTYLDERITYFEEVALGMTGQPVVEDSELDQLFRSVLKTAWN